MDDSIKKVDYFAVEIPNRPGEAARALGAIAQAGVNLLALTGFPTGARRSQLDFIPEDSVAFRKAIKSAGLKVGARKTGFLIQGEDRPGAVAGILQKIGDAGINVTAIDALCAGAGRYGAIFWVKPEDVRKAVKVVGAT